MLVFGGSLGARSINEAAVDGLAGAPFRVLHASGTRDLAALRARLGDPAPDGYDLRGYVLPFGPALAAADLVVARSGGSIFEVAAHGRPAILVPYPHAAADHQAANARWMAAGGAAVVLPDAELDAAAPAGGGRRAARRPRAPGRDGRGLGCARPPRAAREVADELRAAAAAARG